MAGRKEYHHIYRKFLRKYSDIFQKMYTFAQKCQAILFKYVHGKKSEYICYYLKIKSNQIKNKTMYFHREPKVQLILKCSFGVFKSTKKTMKFL